MYTGHPLFIELDVNRGNASVKLGTEKFFLNNEMHETTRKNFMEAALTVRIRRYLHEIFSCHFVSFVVKKYQCYPASLTHYRRIMALSSVVRGAGCGRVAWDVWDVWDV